jgi:hypothetical protein
MAGTISEAHEQTGSEREGRRPEEGKRDGEMLAGVVSAVWRCVVSGHRKKPQDLVAPQKYDMRETKSPQVHTNITRDLGEYKMGCSSVSFGLTPRRPCFPKGDAFYACLPVLALVERRPFVELVSESNQLSRVAVQP